MLYTIINGSDIRSLNVTHAVVMEGEVAKSVIYKSAFLHTATNVDHPAFVSKVDFHAQPADFLPIQNIVERNRMQTCYRGYYV